jgi:hypothetical protein
MFQLGAQMSSDLDCRLNAIRDDAADIALQSLVTREKYITPTRGICVVPTAPVFSQNNCAREIVTELLFGEEVKIFEDDGSYSWIQSTDDHYVGYVESHSLNTCYYYDTHHAVLPFVLVFKEPSFVSDVVSYLPMYAKPLTGETTLSSRPSHPQVEMTFINQLGWVPSNHISKLPLVKNFLDIAKSYLGAPYKWGGRSALGIDCSALVQLCLRMHGIRIPRDTSLQLKSDIVNAHIIDNRHIRPKDIIYFKRHVGIALSSETLLHADGISLCVREESLAAAMQARNASREELIVVRFHEL